MRIFEIGLQGGASRFIRWSVSPFLILVMLFFAYIGFTSGIPLSNTALLLILPLEFVLLSALLALWGVPLAGRVVTSAAFFATAFLLFKEVVEPAQSGESWSDKLLSILSALAAFVTLGLPSAFYTLRGRFPWRQPSSD
ncbi:hypothetical protein AAFN60_00395 [Roseibacillus persicicus]|uniref:hypothetical protein n=1 Tax=Roseibacillus persicicus TaxID=454148 RepID=UPI00398B8B10